MRHRRPTVLAAAAVVLAGAIGGCSDDDSGGDAPTTTTGSAPVTTGGIVPDQEGLADEGIGALDEVAQSLLIQEGELGDPTFVDAGYTPGQTDAICGGADDEAHPPDVLVGVVFDSVPLATTVVEEIRVYETTEAASEAYAASTTTECGGGTDATTQVGADRAARLDADGPPGRATFIVAQIADTVLAVRVAGDGIDPVDVAAFGVGRVAAALEN